VFVVIKKGQITGRHYFKYFVSLIYSKMGFRLRNLQKVQGILDKVLALDFIKAYCNGAETMKGSTSRETVNSILMKRQDIEDELRNALLKMGTEVSETERVVQQDNPGFIKLHLEGERQYINSKFSREAILNIVEHHNSKSPKERIEIKHFNSYWNFVCSLLKSVDHSIAKYIQEKLKEPAAKTKANTSSAFLWLDSDDLFNKKVSQLANLLGEHGYIETKATSKSGFRNLFLSKDVAPVNWTKDISALVCLLILLEEKQKIILPPQRWKSVKKYFIHNHEPVQGKLAQIYSNLKNGSQSSSAESELREILAEVNL
jgi:hypothetical protein